MQNKKDTKRSLWGQAILVLIKLLLSKSRFQNDWSKLGSSKEIIMIKYTKMEFYVEIRFGF